MPTHRKEPPPRFIELWDAIRWIAYADFNAPVRNSPENVELIRAEDALRHVFREGEIGAYGLITDFRVIPDLAAKEQTMPKVTTIEWHFWERGKVFWEEGRVGDVVGYSLSRPIVHAILSPC